MLKKNNCDFCGDKFYKKIKMPDIIGWVNMCKGCYRSYKSYVDYENCKQIYRSNQSHVESNWSIVDADFDGSINSENDLIEFIWDIPVLPKTRNEAILTSLLYDGYEEIRKRFELRKKIKKKLYCKFFKICKGFYLNSIVCTHKGGECGKFRKFEEMEKNENPKLSLHEILILCPKCKNKTLLVSNKEEFNMCVNVNCCYFEKKQNYQDSIGYSW